MVLGIRTDSPTAELYLFDGTRLVASKSWQADRELSKGLLQQIETLLGAHSTAFPELSGLFVYMGPGSFTGLRIGMTVMNTLSYALDIPIVGTTGEKWSILAASRLEAGENDRIVLPHYGADARITAPRK